MEKYKEDSEHINFPPVKLSPDLINELQNKKTYRSNKSSKIDKSKSYLALTIIMIILFIAIILFPILIGKNKIKKEDEKGGFIYLTIKNPKSPKSKETEIILFNSEIIGITKDDFSVEYINHNKLRNLNVQNEVNITENKFKLIDDSIKDNDLSFKIKFKKELNSMKEMFKNNTDLLSIDFSSLQTKNINNMHSTFLNCNYLENINFSNFDSKNISIMDSTFENCFSLITLDLSSFETNNLSSMTNAFKNCIRLKNINLKNFILNDNVNISSAFDSLGETIFIIINDNLLDRIKYLNNIQIISINKSCTENIEDCKICDKDNQYMCQECKEGFIKSNNSLECITNNRIIPSSISLTIEPLKSIIINEVHQMIFNESLTTIPIHLK